MTSLPVLLDVLQQTRMQLHMGRSLNSSLETVLGDRSDSFCKTLKVWLIKVGAGQSHQEILNLHPELTKTAPRRQFVHALERGLKGATIDGVLAELEQEFYFAVENNFERKLQILPLKLLIPLTLFILPAVMGIILGPFIFLMKGG